MQANIPITKYLAYNAPQNAAKLLNLWNVKVSSGSPKELSDKLAALFHREGESVLLDMANLHPDKELIRHVLDIQNNRNTPIATPMPALADAAKSSACGCSSSCDGENACKCGGKCGGAHSAFVQDLQVYGMDGLPSMAPAKKESLYPVLLFGGLAVALGYVIYKNG